MACCLFWFISRLSPPHVARAVFDQAVMMPFTSQITHVSSESFSSEIEDSYEPTSNPESRDPESLISVTPLATKFPSPMRKMLQPSGELEENLESDKMSDGY